MPFSTATANSLLNSLTTLDVALFSVMPNAGGTGGTEISAGGYTRIASTMGSAALGKRTSTADVLYAVASGAWTGIVGWGFYDALTVGNFLYGEYLSASEALPFTAAVSGNLITAPAHGMIATNNVVLDASQVGVQPGGITATTVYFVISPTTDTFQVSLTSGGAAVTVSASGEGLWRQVSVQTVNIGAQFKISLGNLTLALR